MEFEPMKKFTNHSPGLRGILVKDENDAVSTVWLEPGASKAIDPKTIVGRPPDLGEAKAAPATEEDADELATLTARVAELEAQLDDVAKQRDTLAAQVAAFDKDGDGKTGGSKPKA
jgi:hypothetical protein